MIDNQKSFDQLVYKVNLLRARCELLYREIRKLRQDNENLHHRCQRAKKRLNNLLNHLPK